MSETIATLVQKINDLKLASDARDVREAAHIAQIAAGNTVTVAEQALLDSAGSTVSGMTSTANAADVAAAVAEVVAVPAVVATAPTA